MELFLAVKQTKIAKYRISGWPRISKNKIQGQFKDLSRNFLRFQGHFYENFQIIIISAMLENTLKITKY